MREFDLWGNEIKEDTLDSHWIGMPEFIQDKIEPYKKITLKLKDGGSLYIRFRNSSDFNLFSSRLTEYNNIMKDLSRDNISEITEQKITNKTKSIWFPFKSHWGLEKKVYISNYKQNRYPVYIVSKGRYNNGLTTKALNKMGVPHYIVVESSEYEDYVKNTTATVLILPEKYLSEYDTCDDLGDSKSKGPGSARNFCIDHSKKNGYSRHWVMDDNLDAFHYLNKNEKYEVLTGATLSAAEDFVDRYKNIPVSGFNYYSFCKKTDKVPPFVLNTRIYSCLLIDNNSGYRWRGRYNEDTDLSLRVLKDGLCTVQFNAFLCGKVTTQRMRGGNSTEFYDSEGTLPKSKMLEDLHPDVSKVVWKFNRWHHQVDYSGFKKNKLILKNEIKFKKIDNYGLKKVTENKERK